MCGIAGYFLNKDINGCELLLGMTRSFRHRGPDDEGLVLINPESKRSSNLGTSHTQKGATGLIQMENASDLPHRIGLGHRRFSIFDLSTAGHQPFWSYNGRACLIYNGALYNYLELREELSRAGHKFLTNTDTEVLLNAYLEWGEDCFRRFNGFWAIAIYDIDKGGVLLSRDRFGIAPLYIATTHQGIWWASEMKSMFSALGLSAFPVREQSVYDFAQHGWSDLFGKTFFEGIEQFPRASFSWIDPYTGINPKTYWSLSSSRMTEDEISINEAAAEIRNLLNDSVSLRLRGDAPIGFELSGGVDSSAISMVASGYTDNMKIFTVSFPGHNDEEVGLARKVVHGLRCRAEHIIIKPQSEELFDRANEFFKLMEEPFHSPNLLTYQRLWSSMAERGIRISIDGGAGDEVFAGYPGIYLLPYLRYLAENGHAWRFMKELIMSSENIVGTPVLKHLSMMQQVIALGRKSGLKPKQPAIPSERNPFISPPSAIELSGPSTKIERLMLDIMGDWLMSYWLTSGDKCERAVPMEVRTPYLDYRLTDFAFRLPVTYLIRNGKLKWILREAVKDIVPKDVITHRAKYGFPFDYQNWLKTVEQSFFRAVDGLDCPYVNIRSLKESYSTIMGTDPVYLWRLICICLWWKIVVLGEKV